MTVAATWSAYILGEASRRRHIPCEVSIQAFDSRLIYEPGLQDVSTPYPPEVFAKNEVRADVEGPCLMEVFAQEVELTTTRPLTEAGLLDPPFPALKRRRTLTDWRRFEKVGSFHRPGLAEEEFLGLPIKDGARVPPDGLRQYRQTHEYLGPGCLCPLLERFSKKAPYKEAAMYLAIDGPYKGEYVAECAKHQCGYLVPIERIYPKKGVFLKTYPLRGAPCPPQVFTEREERGIAVGRTYSRVAADIMDPPFPAPEFEGMDLRRRTDWWNLWRLELKEKPGLTEEQFLGLFVKPQTTDESGSDSELSD
ncbi:hypothetical protein F5887DRAFT_1077042 [Amanita rubescens]|nr:hypothetical protein F5887DRAFT_1077042 [Amanita rubescens]